VQTDAVFTGAGARKPDRALHHLLAQTFSSGHLAGVARVEQVAEVEVAVADVPEDRRRELRGVEDRALGSRRRADGLGEALDRGVPVGVDQRGEIEAGRAVALGAQSRMDF
jgi:hypothetical protein